MVLTEAFAAGTPVIASEIAGYRDVVTDGVDGVLVPPADPQALAEELQLLAHEPERLVAMGEAGRRSAERYAWPRVADQVKKVYEWVTEPTPAPLSQAESAASAVRSRPRTPATATPALRATRRPRPPSVVGAGSRDGRRLAGRLGPPSMRTSPVRLAADSA